MFNSLCILSKCKIDGKFNPICIVIIMEGDTFSNI